MTSPLVSVVMPVFDGARYIAEAIEDVLAQTHHPIELIVVDDGSTDETAQIARGYASSAQLLVQAHEGIGAARNTGLRVTRGEYLAFCDADDRFPTDRFERQLAAIESDPALDAVFGEIEEFVSPGLDADITRVLRAPVARRPARVLNTALVRTSSFWRVGAFGTDLGRGVDLDWMARADEIGLRTGGSVGVAVVRRLHDASTGVRQLGNEDDYLRVVRAAMLRRRQDG